MNTHHHFGDKQLGLIIGAVMGFIKGFVSLYTDMIETIFLAVVGSIFGFLTTSILKWLKNKYF